MRKAFTLVLSGVLFFLPGNIVGGVQSQTKSQTSLHKKTVTRASTSAASKAGAGKARPAATRLVRTKSGRLTRVAVHAPPAPTFQTHPDSDRYVEIQKALADRGYFKGEPNGVWGDDSVDALRRYQAGASLPDDGKISALTLTGLGLGPRHDGSTASTVPAPEAPTAPSVVGSTTGPAASTPPPPTVLPPPLPF